MNLEALNIKYTPLTPEQRIQELYKDFQKVLLTSSFGTTSVFLLHLFHKMKPDQKVHFLDTTYHFAETLDYKDQLIQLLNLDVVTVLPEEWKNKFTKEDHTWSKDPDFCCSINKVEPLDKIKPDFEIWVSGLMATQTEHRDSLGIFEQKDGIIKFYPILNMKEEQVQQYIAEHKLPPHPLKSQGYNSVGCFHCTSKGKGREGRWANKSKTECGLHL